MPPDLFANSTLPVLEQAAAFAQARHGVLAGNIANLDTPGYKSRDLSTDTFQTSLKKAIEKSRRPDLASPGHGFVLGEGLRTGDASDKAARGLDYDALSEVRESMRRILYHDDSDVSLEHQITEIAKNQAQHNLAIQLMSLQFRQLRSAISENIT